MIDERKLRIRGNFANIPLIIDFVAEAAQEAGLSDNESYHCQMAADEACTNVIEHAYGGDDRGDIELTCAVSPGRFVITIVDEGIPFDPEGIPEPDIPESLDKVKPGGIGLHLMRKLMDEVRFEFLPGKNVLTMVKNANNARPGAQGLQILVNEERPGVWLVTPLGRLDSNASPRLEETLQRLLSEGVTRLAVDFHGVTYISSRGLKTLVSAWRAVRGKGGDLVLARLSGNVASVFDLVGFDQVFEMFDTLPDALDALR